MKTPTSSKQKPCILLCNSKGFTLLELLVTSTVAAIFVILSLGLFVQQRRQFLTEQARAETNQNLRLGMDLIGSDIRQAGERLESDTELARVSVINGTSGAPDTLVLQRKLTNEILPVCQTITAGTATSTIDIAVTGTPGVSNCAFSDGNANGLTDNLDQWQAYRANQDGTAGAARSTTTSSCAVAGGTDRECVYAYIHDPVANRGEFFVYAFENSGTCATITGRTCNRIYRADGGTWQNTYTYTAGSTSATQPRIYILEERRYSLTADANTTRTDDYILQMSLNRQNPVLLANRLGNMQIMARTWRGDVTGFNAVSGQPVYVNSLRDAQYFKVILTVVSPDMDVPVANLTLSSQFFPRNALSAW